MFCRSLFVLFLLIILLSALRFTDSDCSICIFKLFLIQLGFISINGLSGAEGFDVISLIKIIVIYFLNRYNSGKKIDEIPIDKLNNSWSCRCSVGFGVIVFNATYFSYIVAVSFIGGRNRRKPPTCRKTLKIFIT